jgi:nitrate reductase NapD
MSPIGKPVVVLEAPNQRIIMKVIDAINQLDGMLNTRFVYHEFEKLEY